MKKIKVTFCMEQIITGGIEKCLIRILDKMYKLPEYEFNIVVKRPITEKVFLDFFAERNISVINFQSIEDSIGQKPLSFFKRKLWRIKKFFCKIAQKKRLISYFKDTDIIVDYFNCAFYHELKSIHKPKIGWWHCSFDIYNQNHKKHRSHFLNAYDRFVVLTKETKENLSKILIQNSCKIIQIYNPIDICEIRKNSDVGKKPHTDKPYFVFLGRFHIDKDHNTVIDAIYKVKSKIPDVLIYFIGDGDKRAEYQTKVNKLGLEKNIIFTGIINNPYGYVKNAVANILSSPSEGLSTVLIESACIGTLNISSECPSCASEILLEGKGGILFPIGDSERLAQIIIDVLENKVNSKQLINNSTNAIDRFDNNKIIPQIDNLFKECLK